ncbi:MAG: gyrase subunit A protein [candidate division WWE3 bacterium GW2011_GWF2_41_45]|uniref:DNA gyrase subunit A n=3 Tax=Katanobacteria TaxID=422282 RepID=A0A1F4W263_UNCKA|nr:MAG: gyrase subunit A protein [candidate division WWE3 bacterium GW2011_GWC2_41_23]KKS10516.1 MAG: gyrase subunit A protein [candidate division WWE3 bacterium GW2011_GWF2_41_45]KKS20289.1 MAG: gyrase subunit A protein [candidate division WWE3 bacterium GW2011_GWE1_41_72]KKS27764.1 MAG: DNA gyrase subunit A, DNA gyrase subunit A [candidate division WWE3 bacterium GW2011_GWC1_42_102]KKS30291.1 MAG: gyrase subunit A protein [candidate division WWE3 bacterium GW2011_GWD2_42_11]KKS51045.1 MAG: g
MAKKPDEITQLTQEELDERVLQTEITDEMQSSYLDYAMSVIVSRALPDVRDGLKPVQRRVIYAMQDQGMSASGKFHKCAAVIGEVLKKYHPHGDTSVYEALVRMAQDFNLRYPLVFPQGNFGSIDGDPPAAMRYTECKLHKISEELYSDIDKETIAFVMNDLQNYEPTYLPSLLPNLLLNGAAGIAVGMATNVPPHNLSEVVDGINLLIEKAIEIGEKPGKEDKDKVAKLAFESSANVEDLVKIIKGPDFPTGGTIYDQKEIIQMYATGKGRVVTRAKMGIEEGKGEKMKLVVTEIPYMVNKSTLISKIADLVKDKRIEGISDLRDESNKQGLRIVVELKKEAVVMKIQNQLYKYTQLQNTFNANFVALLDNEPKLMTLKMILEEFVRHRQQVVVKRTIYLLRRAREREHVLQGLKIALDNLDAVIALIRASKDAEVAKLGLMKKFGLSEIQSQAILDMQLRKLAALERQKIEDELREIVAIIDDFEDLIASPTRIIETVKKELEDLKERYGDKRKSIVVKGKVGELSDEDLIIDEPCIVTISESGYIKRLKEDTYKKQGRGGKGVVGQGLKEEDSVDTIRTCSTHDWALFFTNTGRVYKMRVWDIPESSRTAKGTPLVNFLSTTQSERIEAFLTVTTSDMAEEKGFVFFVTEKGVVKRTGMPEFSNIRSSGILAIKLGAGDNLAFAGITYGDDDVLITTTMGQSIRFSEKDVRDMGRAAGGVTGIKLSKGNDSVVGSVIVPKSAKNIDLLVVSDKGYGKRTKTSEYKTQSRAGSGILTYKVTDKTGHLVSARAVNTDKGSDVLLATSSGKVLRIGAKNVPVLGRATQGVRLIKLDSGDTLTSAAVIEEALEETDE